MRDVYLAKAAADPTNDPAAAEAIRDHFDQMNATLRSLEKERAEAEPRQLEALLQFAARAYRRPLTLRNAPTCSPIITRTEPKISHPTKSPARCHHRRADGAGLPLPSRHDGPANSGG